MPSVNEIYKGNDRIRILHVNPKEDTLIYIRMNQRLAYPEIQSLQEFKNDVFYGNYVLEQDEAVKMPSKLLDKQISEMENRWNIISNYVKDEPICYDQKKRTDFVKEKSNEYNCTKYTVNQLLYIYWCNGMTKYTLIPRYDERGGRGKSKTQINKKLGRPTKYNYENEYVIISDEVLTHIKFIINNYYNKTNNTSLKRTYQEFLKKYYIDPISNKLANAYPTEAQFRYHAMKYIDQVKRIGSRKFNKDLRGIVGSSRGEAFGPGEKYQIDATMADIYLVSPRDHNSVVGRPILYFVTDVFSHMITGFYVGLENISWKGAMMALYYTFSDKQVICNQYGVNITSNEWPCCGLPKKILCDNGEMISQYSNMIIQALGVDIENAAAWRPDLKGIVEQSFHQLNIATKSILPGAVQPDFNIRGSHDYRKDAALTLKEYGKIIILYILKHNARMMTKNLLNDEDALKDHVPPIPIEIWNWGVKNRSGQLRKVPEEQLKIALLPHTTARVTEKGIKFKNICYTCSSAIRQDWFSQARMKKTWTCDIAYDPRDLNHIYILEFEKPELAEKTSAYYNLYDDWAEEDFDLWLNQERNDFAKNERNQIEKQNEYDNEILKIINIAQERSNVTNISTFKSVKGENIRKERAKDNEQVRREESFVRKDSHAENESISTLQDNYNDDDILSNLIAKIQNDSKGD